MSFSARLLVPGDEQRAEAFLKPHTPFAFFIRSNMAKFGFVFEGKPYQGEFIGAFEGEKLRGVLLHGWLGNVQIFVEDLAALPALAKVFCSFRKASPRIIKMMLGPQEQVEALLPLLGLDRSALCGIPGESEELFALALDKMIVPPLLGASSFHARRAQAMDVDLLTRWRHDFFVEVFDDMPPGKATMDIAREETGRRVDDGDLFVLEDNGKPVSYCGVGGFLPDWTHVGPVWTPPELRGRGYAKAVTAGALLKLREQGMAHGTLFAVRPDAKQVYRSIGFETIGRWMFEHLKVPVEQFDSL